METETAALAALIGSRVRQERQSRSWTLDQLADRAGVSRRMIVSVEQGTVNPSLGTLLRISEALQVGLPVLVESPQPRPIRVTRAGEHIALWTGAAGGRGLLVASADDRDAFELWDWTMGPGDARTSEPHTPGTKELVQVHEGALTIEVDGETTTLGPGDAISFPGDVPHSYSNRTASPVRFSLAVSEPIASAPRSDAAHA